MAKELNLQGVFISHAWGGQSDDVVAAITDRFKQKNIPFVLDKNHLGYRGSIQEFMIQLGKADMVIIVLSNKYLRSEFCMFELIQIYKHDRLRDRIYPIVLDEVNISRSTDRIELVKYWEDQITQLQSKLKELNSLSHIEGITDDLNLYTEIRNNIAKLTSILRDINSLNLRMHSDGDFEVLCQSILSRMHVDMQPSQANTPNLLNNIHTSKVWIKWAGLTFIAVFLILGLGKIIFGKETKEQNTSLQNTYLESLIKPDSLYLRTESLINSGILYFPDKDCAWNTYKQLEKLFPDYPQLTSLKKEIISGLITKAEDFLRADEPFEAQLLVYKIKELDPANLQVQDIENLVDREKLKLTERPKDDLKIVSQSPKQSNNEHVNPNQKPAHNPSSSISKTTIPEVKLDPKVLEPVSVPKTEHRLKTITIPPNTELVLTSNEEFSSDGDLQINKIYYFRVAKPIHINGMIAIAANDKAEMQFTKIKRSEFKRAGVLEFSLMNVILSNGARLNLKSSNFLLKANSDSPLIISKGQSFKVKTAQSLSIEI